jgi:ATP-binding cassette subfamily B protein
LIVLSTVGEIVSPVIVGKSVDAAISAALDARWLTRLCLFYLALVLVRALLDSYQAFVIQATGQAVTHELRLALFARILGLPVPYFDRNPTGRLLTRVVNDIKSLSELFTASISVLALDLMIIAGTLGAMFWIHWRLAALVLSSFPLVLISIRYFGEKLAVQYRRVRQHLSEINAFLGENIAGIATIQRLGAEPARMEKFVGIVDRHQAAQLDSIVTFALVQPITNVLNGLAMGILIVAGGWWVIKGRITVGVVVAFFGYLRNLFQPVRDLVEKYNTFLSSMVSAERVAGILEESVETAIPETLQVWTPPEALPIRFESVSFRYATRQQTALEDVSFELDHGESLAIVGATGSGKSTLIRLLLRFYEPQEGAIYFGEQRLGEWDKGRLRRSVGVVHQESYLFQGTVRDNLTLGRENFSDSYLTDKCMRAQLWDFIRNRGGLDMTVLEGGTNFSVGERQLLSLARVLVFNPPVLVLDEATSSVDRLLERRLMEAIQESLAGRTSIVIAHRLSTIQNCDRILVLDKGKVAELGTYSQLLSRNGIFARFHQLHARS